MAGIFDFLTGQDTPPAAPKLGAVPAQPSMPARFAAAFKRRLGDAIGAVAHNPIANAAGEFASTYWDGNGMMPAASAASAPKPVATTPLTDQPDYAAGFTPPAAAPALGAMPAVAPMTAAGIRGTGVPTPGTGAFVNNRTGAVTNLDTREVGPNAGPMVDAATYDRMRGFAPRSVSADRYNPTTAAGSFFQAGADMKTRANTEAAQLTNAKLLYDVAKTQGTNRVTMRGQDLTADTARAKLGAEAGLRTAQTLEHGAKAENEATRTAAAQAYLRANPGDYAGAAGIASGRPLPTDKFGAMPSMTGNDVITYDKSGKNPPRIQTPLRPVSEADIQTTMKNNKMTREQVLARLKYEGKM